MNNPEARFYRFCRTSPTVPALPHSGPLPRMGFSPHPSTHTFTWLTPIHLSALSLKISSSFRKSSLTFCTGVPLSPLCTSYLLVLFFHVLITNSNYLLNDCLLCGTEGSEKTGRGLLRSLESQCLVQRPAYIKYIIVQKLTEKRSWIKLSGALTLKN